MKKVLLFSVLFLVFVPSPVFSQEPVVVQDPESEAVVDCSDVVLQISLLKQRHYELRSERLSFFSSDSSYYDGAIDKLVAEIIELRKLQDLHC